MDTPILDFVREYSRKDPVRLHMPGHKGVSLLGPEYMDITEVSGADSLYEADGIIAKSEANASALFGCRTVYSTEGSSQCIRAMLYLVMLYARRFGKAPVIAAGRNAHKTFLTGAALLGLEVQWLYPGKAASYLSCNLSAGELDAYLANAAQKPAAVYLTSPDYLGNTADVAALASVCHKHGVLLAVDNAHGAYLKFLEESRHPMDLGADLCCDSAHKTLPALTGAAYLHLSDSLDQLLGPQVKNAMMLFGSTSPSYLILQALDSLNPYLERYPQHLRAFLAELRKVKVALERQGYRLYGDEPLKLTLDAKAYGYTGLQLAQYLRQHNMEPEFADSDFLVLMLTPEISLDTLGQLERVLCALPRREPVVTAAPKQLPGEQVMPIREAMLSDSKVLPLEQCLGRVLAVPTVGCPPAVPILVCGERITEHAMECLSYYGITQCCVVEGTRKDGAG